MYAIPTLRTQIVRQDMFLLNPGDEGNELHSAYGTLINTLHAINQQQREMGESWECAVIDRLI